MKSRATLLLIVGYWLLSTAVGLCSKEGGANPERWWLYFLLTNAMGIPSTWLLMKTYARMNVNLALVLAGSGAFICMQLTFWGVYRTPLTSVQWAGILAVCGGTILATWTSQPQAASPAATAEAAPGPAADERRARP